jgi:hypothetical protein
MTEDCVNVTMDHGQGNHGSSIKTQPNVAMGHQLSTVIYLGLKLMISYRKGKILLSIIEVQKVYRAKRE